MHSSNYSRCGNVQTLWRLEECLVYIGNSHQSSLTEPYLTNLPHVHPGTVTSQSTSHQSSQLTSPLMNLTISFLESQPQFQSCLQAPGPPGSKFSIVQIISYALLRHGFVKKFWTQRYIFPITLSWGLTATDVVVLLCTFIITYCTMSCCVVLLVWSSLLCYLN